MTMEAETGVLLPRAGTPGFLGPAAPGEAGEGFAREPEAAQPVHTLSSDFWPPEP